jgi:putative addiction module component (TIGR02574 family)
MSSVAIGQNRGDLLCHLLSLSETDRATIAQELIDSLPNDYDWAAHLDPQVRDDWITEVRRRVDELEQGNATTVDGEEVMERLRKRFAQ